MNITEAKTELATIVTAIGEYIGGTRRKRIKFMSAGVQREKEFDSPVKLFDYLISRRSELEAFIASEEAPCATLTPSSFLPNKTVPMIFRRNS